MSQNPYDALLLSMAESFIPFNEEAPPLLDGKIHRYSSRKNKDKSEWYVGFEFPDGHLYCTYGSWRPEVEKKTFISRGETIRDEDIQFLQQKLSEIEKEWESIRKASAQQALKIWERAEFALSHPYLEKKKVKSHKIKSHEGKLIIPLFDSKGNLKTIQTIDAEGNKLFFSGGETKGNFFLLGDVAKSETIYVAEGYATGASIFEAMGNCVAIAFSCHNLIATGHALQIKYPHKKLILCADLGKAGDESIAKWKEFIKTETFQPDFRGKGSERDKDFNDLANHPDFGHKAIQGQLEKSYKISTLIEIINSDSQIEWVIPDLFIKGSVNMIYGGAGSGKSAFCFSIAFAVSQGTKFMWYQCKKQKVLYVDGEHSQAELRTRIKAIINRGDPEMELDPNQLGFVSLEDSYKSFEEPTNIQQKKWRDRLDKIFEQFDIIFVDNLSTLSFFTADDDENGVNSWQAVLSWFRNWKRKGKTIVIVHHANKLGGARGSSILSVETMTQLRIEAFEGKDRNPNCAIHSKITLEKAREISEKKRWPFEIILQENQWKFNIIN